MNAQKVESYQLNKDAYIIEKDNISIAYFPLQRKFFEISTEGKEALINHFHFGIRNKTVENFLKENNLLENPKYPKNKNDPQKPTSLCLALTSGCNLRCIYCYADADTNADVMTFEIAKLSIDANVSNLQDIGSDTIRISFLGGGETLTVFQLLKRIINYINNNYDLKKKFSLVTNATLITPEIARFFKKNNFRITVSLDGPKDIHDKQRPKANKKGSFDETLRGMNLLNQANVNWGIRSTITTINGGSILELIDIAKDMNCGIKLEPITPTGRGDSLPIDPKEGFIDILEKAIDYGEEIGVKIRSSYLTNLGIKTQYCGGNGNLCCVLPNGIISSCSRITKKTDKLFDIYSVRKITPNGITTNQEKLEQLRSLTTLDSKCENCFAKWHCAGGCYSTRLLYHGIPEEHCLIMRYFVWKDIIKNLEKERR